VLGVLGGVKISLDLIFVTVHQTLISFDQVA